MSDKLKFKLYEFAEWATKLLIVGMFSLVWQNNADMQKLKTQIESQAAINAEIKGEISAIKSGYMSRLEVLETIKRVEQNQQIMMLQYKLGAKK